MFKRKQRSKFPQRNLDEKRYNDTEILVCLHQDRKLDQKQTKSCETQKTIMKNIKDKDSKRITEVSRLLNKTYDTGNLPQDFVRFLLPRKAKNT